MELTQNKLIISPIAYIKSLMYFQRFSSEFLDEKEYKYSYGLLLGFIDDFENETLITDFIPIKEFGKEFIKFDKYSKLYENIENLNQEFSNDEYPEYIIGWARNTLNDDFEPTVFDKENHIRFINSIHQKSILWVFNFNNLMVDDGFRIYSFKSDFKVINITSELFELSYKFSNDINFEDLVQLAVEIEEKRKTKEILIKGISEN